MISLNIHQDVNGSFLTNVITPSDHVNHVMLAANTNETITVPADAYYAVFQSSLEFFVNIGAAAAVPTADVKDGTGSIPIPVGLRVSPADVINMISATTGRVSVLFYGRD